MTTSIRTMAATALVVSLAFVTAYANAIREFEVPARQTAIRILEAMKPIEVYVEQTDVVSAPQRTTREVVEITVSRVNLRSAPDLESPVMRVATEGEQFGHVSTDGEWRRIRDNGDIMFVSTDYSRVREVTSEAEGRVETKEQLRPGTAKRAREILTSVGRDYRRLTLLHDEAEARFESEYSHILPSRAHPERDRARESLDKIRKYHRLVSQHYERYSALAGGVEPPEDAAPGWSPRFGGSLEAGFGTNTAETRQAGATVAETDVSRSHLSAHLNAELSPHDRINLQLGRTEEIHFAPASQVSARGAYTRRFDKRGRLTAHGGLSNYRNDADDTGDLDRSEFGVHGVFTPTPAFRASGGVALTSTAYPNDEIRDVGDTRLELGAGGDLSETMQWNVAYRHTDHSFDDDSQIDNTQGDLEGALSFATGDRSAIILDGHLESNSFDADNDPREYSRRGLRLVSRSRAPGAGQNEFFIEWRNKDFEADDSRDFMEFRGGRRSRKYTADTDRQTEMHINYRNYIADSNAAFLDYIEGRIEMRRDRGREASAGLFSEGDLYIQYFFENNGAERNPLITQYAWLGISTGGSTVFKIGPHVASNTEIVVIDGAVGPDGDELGAFESPNNTLRYGVKGELRTRERPLRAHLNARYEMLEQYNVDGAPTLNRLQIEGGGTYSLTQQLDASAKVKLYTSGSDDANAPERTETDLLFGLVYHIGKRGQ